MPKDYFKIPKVIWLINRKILNQPVKFPLLCQFLTQGGFPKPLLNLTCDLHFMLPCSLPCPGLGFCIPLQFFSSSPFRTNSHLNCIWIIFWNASPAPICFPSYVTFKSLVLSEPSSLLWWCLGCALSHLYPGSILDAGRRGTLFWFPLSH